MAIFGRQKEFSPQCAQSTHGVLCNSLHGLDHILHHRFWGGCVPRPYRQTIHSAGGVPEITGEQGLGSEKSPRAEEGVKSKVASQS